MNLLYKIIITLFICYIEIYGVVCLYNVWTKELDIKKTFPNPFNFIYFKKQYDPPAPDFKLFRHPSNFKNGLKVYDVVWENDYDLLCFKFENKSSQIEISDVRFSFSLPRVIVNKKIMSQVGMEDVLFPEETLPAGIVNKKTGVMNEVIEYYSNNLKMNIRKANPNSSLSLFFIIKDDSLGRNIGFFSLEYSFIDEDGNRKTNKVEYQILKSQNQWIIDTSKTVPPKLNMMFSPKKRLIFKDDGSIEQK